MSARRTGVAMLLAFALTLLPSAAARAQVAPADSAQARTASADTTHAKAAPAESVYVQGIPADTTHAPGAPADSALSRYFRAISDSTDAYFGLSAQRADTAGLDSTLVYLLDNPDKKRRSQGRPVSFAPSFAFNRAIGVLYGGSAAVGSSGGIGQLKGILEWANGPNDWYGGGDYSLGRFRDYSETGWTARLRVGRRYTALDRDDFEPLVRTSTALFTGADRYNYMRKDGLRAEYRRLWHAWKVSFGYRNELESPLATTAAWNLFNIPLDLVPNTPATLGRASEALLQLSGELPVLPIKVEGWMWNAGGALGGDLGYHRYLGAAGTAIGVGRHFAFAPQAEYGRVFGSALPQDIFYSGGQYSLVTILPQSIQGTGYSSGRVELLMHDDLLEVFRLRKNAVFPIQLSVFGASAARWGYDPATGIARLTPANQPGRQEWISEAGASLLYRIGLPTPDSFIRLDYAWPLGPGDREPTWFLGWRPTLHMLRHR